MSQKRPPPAPEPGEVLGGRYKLEEQIGKGGFGIVFRATQVDLDEHVAIKVVRPHVAEDPALAARFEREVFIAKQLRHPNTIRVFDVSRTPGGLPYYVMEYVEGESLAAHLEKSGTLSPQRTGHIAIQILKGLAEAHDKGVVHRDLKPANVLMCKVFGESDFVKVLDFGIAKALSGPRGKATSQSTLLGTPSYLSPEQVWGSKDIDGRSDLYAVGLIMAECLTGRAVVDADSVVQMVAAHGSPRPLALAPEVLASPLAPVIRRALDKDPGRRYATAQAMIEAIGAALDGKPSAELPFLLVPSDDISPAPLTDTPITVDLAGSPAAVGSPDWAQGLAPTLGARPEAQADPGPEAIATRSASMKWARPAPARRTWLLAIAAALVAGVVGLLIPGLADPERQPAPAPRDMGEAPLPPGPSAPVLDMSTAPASEPVTAAAAPPLPGAVSAGAAWWPVMRMHILSFGGAPGVDVSFQDQLLGTTPFSIIVPGLPGEVEMVLTRPGRAEERVRVRLDEERFTVPP